MVIRRGGGDAVAARKNQISGEHRRVGPARLEHFVDVQKALGQGSGVASSLPTLRRRVRRVRCEQQGRHDGAIAPDVKPWAGRKQIGRRDCPKERVERGKGVGIPVVAEQLEGERILKRNPQASPRPAVVVVAPDRRVQVRQHRRHVHLVCPHAVVPEVTLRVACIELGLIVNQVQIHRLARRHGHVGVAAQKPVRGTVRHVRILQHPNPVRVPRHQPVRVIKHPVAVEIEIVAPLVGLVGVRVERRRVVVKGGEDRSPRVEAQIGQIGQPRVQALCQCVRVVDVGGTEGAVHRVAIVLIVRRHREPVIPLVPGGEQSNQHLALRPGQPDLHRIA